MSYVASPEARARTAYPGSSGSGPLDRRPNPSPLPKPVELEDLISAGTLGLIQAVDRVQSNRGHKLKTLAEHRPPRNNASFTALSVATKRSWKDRESGERQSKTEWHRCIVWGKLGEFAAALTKGAHVQIEGEIRTREYTQKKRRRQKRRPR